MRYAVFAITIFIIASPLQAAIYQIRDLGTLGGTSSFALDVNSNKEVTGNGQEPLGEPSPRLNAFSWQGPGPMTNLGVLSGSNNFSRGYAINDAGVIVGESDNNASRAFVFRNGAMEGLTRLAGDNDRGVAHDVNNAGVIVGISSNGTVSRPTKWVDSGASFTPSDLGTIAGTSAATGRAWAINQAGVAVGLSTNSSGSSQATMWDGATIVNLTSLGDGTRFSQAYGVNASNVAVGSSSTGQTVGELIGTASTTAITRAFRWQSGNIIELSPFNFYTPVNNGSTTNYHSVANDINDNGLIVGNSQRVAGSPAVATLWLAGAPVNLNTLLPLGTGWDLRSAEGINAAGDIVGYGVINGETHAFLMTAVPEPATGVMCYLAASLGAMLRRHKRLARS